MNVKAILYNHQTPSLTPGDAVVRIGKGHRARRFGNYRPFLCYLGKTPKRPVDMFIIVYGRLTKEHYSAQSKDDSVYLFYKTLELFPIMKIHISPLILDNLITREVKPYLNPCDLLISALVS